MKRADAYHSLNYRCSWTCWKSYVSEEVTIEEGLNSEEDSFKCFGFTLKWVARKGIILLGA